MANYTKVLLSGSTNGKQIKVAATSAGGTTIHTAVSGTASLDEVWLFADNNSTSDVLLTLEFGGQTDIDNTIKVTIPGRGNVGTDGLVPVVTGLLLQNSLVVTAYAGTTNVIKLSGYVHRIA